MSIQLYDRSIIEVARKTNDGYLVAFARVARSGVQIYAGREVGKPELEKVRVYRPETEVFKRDALRSFAHKPVTSNHPSVQVNADNWKKFTAGQTGEDVVRDGQFVRVPMILMDAHVVQRAENGERELSAGYTCDLSWEAGVSPDGDEYDAIQKNIRANHVAVVKTARGGTDLRIGDNKTCPHCGEEMSSGGTCSHCGYKVNSADGASAADNLDNRSADTGDYIMPQKTIMIDGVSCEMSDIAAQVVQRHVANLEKQITDNFEEFKKKKKKMEEDEAQFKTDTAALQTQVATLTTQTKDLEKRLADEKVTPEKLDGMVRDRHAVIEKASKVLGDKLITKDKSNHEIRKQVVDLHVGDAAKDWNETQVEAAFATIKAEDSGNPSPPAGNGDNSGAGSMAKMFQNRIPLGDARTQAYDARDKALTNAWQNPNAA